MVTRRPRSSRRRRHLWWLNRGMATDVIHNTVSWSLWATGVYFQRNFLLRSVTLPDPSTRTTYWSCWRTSITWPVLSHVRGWGLSGSVSLLGDRLRVTVDVSCALTNVQPLACVDFAVPLLSQSESPVRCCVVCSVPEGQG